MKIGLQIGPEFRRYADKANRLVADAQAAEAKGFASVWVPQIPGEFDALTAITLMGNATARLELGTAVLPIQTRHPVAMAQEILSNQIVCEGRFVPGLGPSHHWIIDDMLGLPYEKPAALVRDYLEVLNGALAGPGKVEVENERFRVNSPIDVTDRPTEVLLAALGPVMLRIAGEQASGTILWLADERSIAEHVAPKICGAADKAGRPAPRIVAGVPVALCAPSEVDEARARASQLLSHAEYSPNYERLLETGDAKGVGDLLIAGDEAAVRARLQRFADAGTTDLAVRVLPLGSNRDERIASKERTIDFLSSLCPSFP
ncbi:MAG: TIGR03564 family F420-dependent LLM class oxidoreductase [Myxococcota bacterium]